MKHDKLDHIIRQKLESVDPAPDPGHWDLFEQLLDATEAGPAQADASLDEVVHDKLFRYRAPYQAEHWTLLMARMRAEVLIVREIIFRKSIEASLVALFLLLFLRLGPDSDMPYRMSVPVAALPPADQEVVLETISPSPPAAPIAEAAAAADARAVVTEPPAAPPRDLRTAPFLSAKTAAAVSNSSSRPLDLDSPLGTALPPDLDQLMQETVTTLPTTSASSVSPATPAALLLESPDAGKYKKTFLNIGMFGSGDYNRVITPPDNVVSNEMVDRYALGYGGGVSLGLEWKRWEVGTGLIYAARQYQPPPVTFIRGIFSQGYTAETLSNIQLNVLQIPINTRFNFLQKDKWRFYAQTGASLQVVFEANYFVDYPSFLPLPSTVNRTPASKSAIINNQPGGWFEGGAFSENSYISANFGLGLERYFTERWSMFLQPTYQHAFGYFSEGLGPTEDHIHTMSILTGIRVRLKQN